MMPAARLLCRVATAVLLAGCSGGSSSAPPPPAAPAPGGLITHFGSGGVATSNPSSRDDLAQGVTAIGTKLYVVGADQVPGAGDGQWRIEKWCT